MINVSLMRLSFKAGEDVGLQPTMISQGNPATAGLPEPPVVVYAQPGQQTGVGVNIGTLDNPVKTGFGAAVPDERVPILGPGAQAAAQATSVDPLDYSNYFTDAFGNLADDVRQAQRLGTIANQYESKLPPVAYGNDDFYAQPIPIVAGSINGKVIGSQLVTGGGNALVPIAAYQQGRNQLQDLIMRLTSPKTITDPSYKPNLNTREDPETAEAFAQRFGELYTAGVEEFRKAWRETGQDYLDKNTDLGKKFANYQSSMAYLGKDIKGVWNSIDEMNKLIRNPDARSMVSPSLWNDFDQLLKGTYDLTAGAKNATEISMNLKDKLGKIKVGIAPAGIATAANNMVYGLQSEIKNINNKNLLVNSAEYKDAIETLKTKYKLSFEEFLPEEAKTRETGPTEQEVREAQLKKATSIAKNIAAANWNENDADYNTIIEKSARLIYDMYGNIEKDLGIQFTGERERPITVNVNNVPQAADPHPGFFKNNIVTLPTRGRIPIAPSGSDPKFELTRTNAGGYAVRRKTSEGTWVTVGTYAKDETKSALQALVGSFANDKDMVKLYSEISNDAGGVLSNAMTEGSNSTVNYADFVRNKRLTIHPNFKPYFSDNWMYEEKSPTSLYPISSYLKDSGDVGAGFPVNNRWTKNVEISDAGGGKFQVKLFDENGEMFAPGTEKKQATVQGSSTGAQTSSYLSMPKETLSNAYMLVEKKDGKWVAKVVKDVGDKTAVAEFNYSDFGSEMMKYFRPVKTKTPDSSFKSLEYGTDYGNSPGKNTQQTISQE